MQRIFMPRPHKFQTLLRPHSTTTLHYTSDLSFSQLAKTRDKQKDEKRTFTIYLFCFLRPCSMACSPSTTLLSNSLHLNNNTNQCRLHHHVYPTTLSLNQKNLRLYSKNLLKLSTTWHRVSTITSASGSAGKFSFSIFWFSEVALISITIHNHLSILIALELLMNSSYNEYEMKKMVHKFFLFPAVVNKVLNCSCGYVMFHC